ncbi:MAG: 2OG-Fe(II) oxygenase [Chitinophagales bacterium]|nr:2OG-Fe(II) oxygenase [Chitinophagales bacterium]
MFPILNKVDFKDTPFKFFSSSPSTDEKTILTWLNWFESYAPWRLVETDFYEQYEFSLFDVSLPECVSSLVGEDTLSNLRVQVEDLFDVRLSSYVEVVAHKLVKGQTIRIHNDFRNIKDRETHRVLLQLNRNFDDSNGGFLMIFRGKEPEDLVEIIEPISSSVQGFEISAESHHAVSTIHSGERFTVVYSFREVPM